MRENPFLRDRQSKNGGMGEIIMDIKVSPSRMGEGDDCARRRMVQCRPGGVAVVAAGLIGGALPHPSCRCDQWSCRFSVDKLKVHETHRETHRETVSETQSVILIHCSDADEVSVAVCGETDIW